MGVNRAAIPDRRIDRGAPWATFAVVALTVMVAGSWLPSLLGPLGDSHEGRIYGMISLQVSNLWEKGWTASQWGTSRAPFAAAYSHHPPAFSLWYIPAWRLPGDPTVWIRVLPYLLGLAFLPASFALLRRLGVRAVAAAVAVGLVAATPLYWVYGRIWPALGLVALLAWAVADLREREHVSTGRLVAVCALAAFVVAANWFSMAAAALLGLWLVAGRRLDRVTVTVGATMAVAAGAAFGWVLAAPDVVSEGQQLLTRTTGGGFTTSAYLARIWRWLTELVPWWTVVALPGVVVGLLHRRTRTVTAAATVLGVAWVVAFPNGSYVHDYWIASLCVPLVIALAVMLDRLADLSEMAATATAALGAVAVVAAFAVLFAGAVPAAYITEPRGAGELIAAAEAPDQPMGWVTRSIAEPTWIGYAWHTPVTILREPGDLDQVADDDVVLAELDTLPNWLDRPDQLAAKAIATDRGYALVTGKALRQASTPR